VRARVLCVLHKFSYPRSYVELKPDRTAPEVYPPPHSFLLELPFQWSEQATVIGCLGADARKVPVCVNVRSGHRALLASGHSAVGSGGKYIFIALRVSVTVILGPSHLCLDCYTMLLSGTYSASGHKSIKRCSLLVRLTPAAVRMLQRRELALCARSGCEQMRQGARGETLLDHLVGAREKDQWYREVNSLCGFHVYDQLVPG
jgi:hypothetical protein